MQQKRRSGKKVRVLSGCLILLLLLGITAFYKMAEKGEHAQSQQGFPPVMVETIRIDPEPLENKISAVGSILSNESVTVKPEVSGKINFIGFEEGEYVEKGKVLFQLDAELLDAELQEVKANYDYAGRQYERAKKLKKDGVIPVEEFDERFRAYRNAQSRLNTLSTRLKKHKILTPFSGRVGSRMVSIGDYLAVGDPMVHLEDLSVIKVEFYVPQRYIQKINNGQLVRVVVEPLPQVYEGNVYLIDPQVDPETRSAVIRAKVSNPEEVLKPGMFCTVTVVTEKKDALMVPEEAIVSRGEKHFLYILEGGKAVMKQVNLGIFSDGKVEVETGVKTDDQVIIAGLQKISPGTSVREVTREESKKDSRFR
jgi:membrane fusion protein (multidrug efflux system)